MMLTMNFIRAYTNCWVDDFAEIAKFLEGYVSKELTIHHVGSTSIPNMPAKDIIDIDIECPLGSMQQVIAQLAKAGYVHTGDQGIPTREAFTVRAGTPASGVRLHHLYACEANSPELSRHLRFRDYLLAHPERAAWLAEQKTVVDAQATTREAYIEGKAESYQLITDEAMAASAN